MKYDESKVTPRPWHLKEGDVIRLMPPKASGRYPLPIAVFHQPSDIQDGRQRRPNPLEPTDAETLASARHIVRCVNAHDDLVAALQDALPYVEAFAGDPMFPERDEAADKARAALKLAREE